MSVFLLAIIELLVIKNSKDHSLLFKHEKDSLLGGQFAPARGGQFGPAVGGQFLPATSGQFHRLFQFPRLLLKPMS
jgi:hypothetical protein